MIILPVMRPSILRSTCLAFLIFSTTTARSENIPSDKPPVAPVRPVTDEYFGTRVIDPYRYFENLADPQVQSWIKGQANYAANVLHSIPGRDALLARIRELEEATPYHLWIVRRWRDGDMLYLKRLASENLDKLYSLDAEARVERLLVDPERFAQPGVDRHYSLSFCVPSPDRKYVAYGVAASGSEQTTLHVLNVATGKDLPDTIDRMEAEYLAPRWLPDSSGFVYSRRQLLPDGAPATEVYKKSRSLLHRLGSDPDKDAVIFSMDTSPGVPMADTDFPAVNLFFGSHYAVGQIKHGDESKLTLYTAPVESLGKPNTPWTKVCDVRDEVTEYAAHHSEIYLLTSSAAPRFKIVLTSLEHPSIAKADLILPESAAVVQSLETAADALYVGLLEGGLDRAVCIPYGPSKIEPIATPPGASSASPFGCSQDVVGAYIYTSSWVRGGKIYEFDPDTHSLNLTTLAPLGKFDDVPGYEAEEVLVPSHDGVKVPLSIVHKAGLKLDGSHPTLLNGYGAYGMTMSAHYHASRLAWLERGGVLAFAHVRGGGEFGRDWHLAGQKTTKPNTWKDFIACAEYLIQQRYTSPAKLAGSGGSAGGILIGRAITERPDLFAAALIQVGCVDTIRSETTTNGVPNIPEFGTVKTKEGFDGLLAMSAYAHVQDGVKYPAVLLVHGINDPRVEPWESAKMTARLQAATASTKPVLFRVDYDAGHGIGSTKTQRQQQTADEWAFLLWQMGEAEFQK